MRSQSSSIRSTALICCLSAAHFWNVALAAQALPKLSAYITTNAWTPDLHGPDARRKTAFFSVPVSIADRIIGLAALTFATTEGLSNLLL
jgi:hypothetical protein